MPCTVIKLGEAFLFACAFGFARPVVRAHSPPGQTGAGEGEQAALGSSGGQQPRLPDQPTSMSTNVGSGVAGMASHISRVTPQYALAEARWRLGKWADAPASWTAPPINTSSYIFTLDVDPGGDCKYGMSFASGLRALPSVYSNAADSPGPMGRISTYDAWFSKDVSVATAEAAVSGGELYLSRAVAVSLNDQCFATSAIPIVAHARLSADAATNGVVLWPGLRHSRLAIKKGRKEAHNVDVPWDQKVAQAVWRGLPNGGGTPCMQLVRRGPWHLLNEPCAPGKTSRWHLVNKFLDDPLFDVGFSLRTKFLPARPFLSIKEQLRYKVVLGIDGTTAVSLLTWALPSRSVVALAYPFYMETVTMYDLQPWVHFLPYKYDLSDLREVLLWCFEHDAECSQIAENAREAVARFAEPEYEKMVEGYMLSRIMSSV